MSYRRAFNLLELTVVVLIIGILIAVALPTYTGIRNKGEDNTVKGQLEVAYAMAQVSYEDNETAATGALYAPTGFQPTALSNQIALSSEAENTAVAIHLLPVGAALSYATDTIYVSIPDQDAIVMTEKSKSGKAFCLAVREASPGTLDSNGIGRTTALYGPTQGTPLTDAASNNGEIHYWNSVAAATTAGCSPQGSPPPHRNTATICNINPSDPACTTASPPQNSAPPSIGGATSVGSLLSASPGLWTNSPTAYAYQWYHCNQNTSGSPSSPNTIGCSAISGADHQQYSLPASAANYSDPSPDGQPDTVYAVVTATNAAGSQSTTTNSLPVYNGNTGNIPVDNSLPQFQGTAQVGQTLQFALLNWNPANGISYSWQWARCNNAGVNCSFLGSSNNSYSYTISNSDVGSRLKLVGTATLGANVVPFYTPLSAAVAP